MRYQIWHTVPDETRRKKMLLTDPLVGRGCSTYTRFHKRRLVATEVKAGKPGILEIPGKPALDIRFFSGLPLNQKCSTNRLMLSLKQMVRIL